MLTAIDERATLLIWRIGPRTALVRSVLHVFSMAYPMLLSSIVLLILLVHYEGYVGSYESKFEQLRNGRIVEAQYEETYNMTKE